MRSTGGARALLFAAALSAGLTVAGEPFALDAAWMAFVFKPLTTLLLIAWAWPRGADAPRMRRWLRIGLALSLAGDTFLLWPTQGFLPGLVAFLLAHLAYIRALCAPVRLAAKPGVFALYGVVAALILRQLWSDVPPALQGPVLAYVLCLAGMAAQAAVWWRAAANGSERHLARRAAFGGMLFMVSDSLLAFDKFSSPLPMAALWILLTYWLAQGFIAASLRRA